MKLTLLNQVLLSLTTRSIFLKIFLLLVIFDRSTFSFVNDCALRDEEICVSPCGLKTFYLPRSQGSNNARRLAGWQAYTPRNQEQAFGYLSLAFEYTRSFNNDHIAQYFFGNTCLNFVGSDLIKQGYFLDSECPLISPDCGTPIIPGLIVADNLGLPTNFEGKICFRPRIQNVIVDFNYFLSLDFWCKGLYWRFFAPFVVTYWNLGINCCEHNNSETINKTFSPCYMSENQTQSLATIQEALAGEKIFGDMNSPFDFGRVPFTLQKRIGIADFDIMLGWNAIMSEWYRFAIFLLATIPGGNRPASEIFFEPIVGAGKCWGMGGGFEGYLNFMETDIHSLGFYYFITIDHYFKTFQIRSFDFTPNGPLSRYMLLKEINTSNGYNGNLLNAIDYSTKAVRAGSLFNIDAAFKLSYFIRCWGFDVGYNFWCKTSEKLTIVPRIYPSDLLHRKFGIKQTEGVCYRALDNQSGQIVDTGSLNSTQSKATISTIASTDYPAIINLPDTQTAIAWNSPTNGNLINAYISNPPAILSLPDLDHDSAIVPRQFSNKLFINFNYTKYDTPWEPQISLGGEIEFGAESRLLASLSQYGVWLKGQFNF